ncbi:MAG TPA: hypothetical protein VGN06_13325 [Gaiellaceae bacterium]
MLLSAHGIGAVRFGLTKDHAVEQLTGLFGQPSRRFVNSGCGSRYTEVAWGHLYAEFRGGTFSGFRYIEDGWPPRRYGVKIVRSDRPSLSTAHGVTLGSTLGEVRAAYGRLTFVGTDRWRSADRLIFYDDSGSSRIVEIKTGTCGDF